MKTASLPSDIKLWLFSLPPAAIVILAYFDAWTCHRDCELAPPIVLLSSLGAVGAATVAISIGLTTAAVPPVDRKIELAVRLYALLIILVLIITPREVLFGKFVIERWAQRIAIFGLIALPVHSAITGISESRTKGAMIRLLFAQGTIALMALGGLSTLYLRPRPFVVGERWILVGVLAAVQLGSVIWCRRHAAGQTKAPSA